MKVATPILPMPTKKVFSKLLIFMNLYLHAKNQTISLICSGVMADVKILQSD